MSTVSQSLSPSPLKRMFKAHLRARTPPHGLGWAPLCTFPSCFTRVQPGGPVGTLGLLVKAEAGSRRCPEMPTLAAAVVGPAEGVQRRWYLHPGVTGFFLLLRSRFPHLSNGTATYSTGGCVAAGGGVREMSPGSKSRPSPAAPAAHCHGCSGVALPPPRA